MQMAAVCVTFNRFKFAYSGSLLVTRTGLCHLRDSGGGESAAKRASETAGEQVIGRAGEREGESNKKAMD